MYVFMYVCMYVYVCIYIYTHMLACTCSELVIMNNNDSNNILVIMSNNSTLYIYIYIRIGSII